MKELAAFYKALSDESRLKIIKMLTGKELCVCEIIENLAISQPTVSHHLKILKYAGLINDKKEGKWVFYSLNTTNFLKLLEKSQIEFIKPIAKADKYSLKPSEARNEDKCK